MFIWYGKKIQLSNFQMGDRIRVTIKKLSFYFKMTNLNGLFYHFKCRHNVLYWSNVRGIIKLFYFELFVNANKIKWYFSLSSGFVCSHELFPSPQFWRRLRRNDLIKKSTPSFYFIYKQLKKNWDSLDIISVKDIMPTFKMTSSLLHYDDLKWVRYERAESHLA